MATGADDAQCGAPAGELVIVRHADTEWTESGQHTGRTDIPLNEAGRAKAAALPARLAGRSFAAVWSSPLRRARATARLAGFAEPVLHDELLEWDYGDYEGLTTPQILERRPDWDLWTDGCPGGEQATDVGRRTDALLAMLPAQGDVLGVRPRSRAAGPDRPLARSPAARADGRHCSWWHLARSVSLGREHGRRVLERLG